jgi:hypothetical protein
LPTVEIVAKIVPTKEVGAAMALSHAGNPGAPSESWFLYLAVGAFVVGILVAGILGWLWFRGRKQTDGR